MRGAARSERRLYSTVRRITINPRRGHRGLLHLFSRKHGQEPVVIFFRQFDDEQIVGFAGSH